MRGRGPRMRKRLPVALSSAFAAADDVETSAQFLGPGPSLAWLQGFNVEEALASTNGGPQYQMLDDGDSTNTCAAASCFYSPNNGDPAPWTPYDVWWLRPSSDGRSMWLPQRLRWASGSFARAAAELAEHIMRRRQVRLTPAPPRRLHPRRQVPLARPTNCPQASRRATALPPFAEVANRPGSVSAPDGVSSQGAPRRTVRLLQPQRVPRILRGRKRVVLWRRGSVLKPRTGLRRLPVSEAPRVHPCTRAHRDDRVLPGAY